jgi:hypothetical protein
MNDVFLSVNVKYFIPLVNSVKYLPIAHIEIRRVRRTLGSIFAEYEFRDM